MTSYDLSRVGSVEEQLMLIKGNLTYLNVRIEAIRLYNQFCDYLNTNKLIYRDQSGFRSLHSVVTCLMKNTNDWYLNIDKGEYTGLIFIDLKKAFDTVDHSKGRFCNTIASVALVHTSIQSD